MISLIQRYIKFVFPFTLMVIFFSCNPQNKYNIDVKDISMDITVARFDKEIMQVTEGNIKNDLNSVQEKFPEMFKIFVEQITGAGYLSDTLYYERLQKFFFDKYTQELYGDVNKKYNNITGIENNLTYTFKHFKYYFPKDTVPDIYTVVSNFGFGAGYIDKKLIISLDLFLGSDYLYYPSLFPTYMIRYFREEYIVPESMKAFFEGKFPEEKYGDNDLLSKMIYAGKELFFLDLMMPKVADSIKIRYSAKQLNWCNKYEGEIWNQLIKNKALFETSSSKTARYLNDGPFTNAYGIPQECPARIGAWLGWQIVRKYMDETKQEHLVDVFYENDARKILELSKYKPKV